MLRAPGEGEYIIEWSARVEDRDLNKVVLFRRNGVAAGYIQLQKGDEWKTILNQLCSPSGPGTPTIELVKD